jgi:hypothetical protein
MKRAAFNAIMGSLLLLASTWPSVGQAAADRGAKLASHLVDFRGDDLEAQLIARKMLRKEIAETVVEEADMPSELRSSLRTAWVNVSHAEAPMLLVTYGCSPTGNCDLYGFERATSGWKVVLNSIAQRCSILSYLTAADVTSPPTCTAAPLKGPSRPICGTGTATCARRSGTSSTGS